MSTSGQHAYRHIEDTWPILLRDMGDIKIRSQQVYQEHARNMKIWEALEAVDTLNHKPMSHRYRTAADQSSKDSNSISTTSAL